MRFGIAEYDDRSLRIFFATDMVKKAVLRHKFIKYKYEFMKQLVSRCHAVVKTCRKCVSLWIKLVEKKTTERIPTCETGSHGRSLSLLDV